MLHYARADTHYLLYVYDRVRANLLTKVLGRPNLLQLVWDQSRTVALKRYHKPVFTEDSYLELLHKHKQPLDVQQSSAARLLYAWGHRTARTEDESTGYVLPNHMLMKIAEEMPRELQGVLACCNPVPPLVRQNANELWQLVKQARLVPLIKSETPIKAPSRTFITRTERFENPLFCPHDGLSLDDRQPITRHGTEVEGARRAVPATSPVLTLFDGSALCCGVHDSEEQQNEARTAQSSTSQMKAARVLQTFVNPFGMHHSYRSFLGITCLMQISTREEDFIIDTLMLRDDLHILNEAFTNPKIVKVFHGADSDIEWLQRDLGLYVVGLFDTHPAARSLGLARNSLAHLLMHYCSLSTDKQYQLADWRIRPLLPDMLHYARADTHYLLYVYDRVRADLLTKALGRPNLLQLVWDQSRTVALKRYHKPVFTEDSYLELLHKHKQPLDVQQSSAAQLLYAWRDRTARAEDESTGYVLPNHMLMKIAEEMPRELQGVLACCNPVPPLLRQNSNELWQLVKQARLIPLIKSETPIKAPSRTFITRAERLENPLFCAHDGLSLDDRQPITRHGTEVEGARRAVPATRPVLTLFDDSEEQQNEARTAQSSTSQMKAARVLQTFVNRFGMHHSYRSFLGITCLMQISMREEDFIIDTLMLRDDLHILNEAFTNPNIVKVFHGADSDIEWLQRDLGLYVVGLFDTHPAARSLGLARNSLAHLLMHYCSLSTDKQYQLADWRIRPLLPDMLHYARADTHYLLYVYDRVRADLLTKALGRPNLLQLVWDQSRTVALKRYHKPVFTEDSYLKLLHKHKQPLDVQQSSAARLLYAWRDRTARAEDESTGYVLPNHMLMKIAEEMPRELQGVLACCNPVPPLVRQNANELWQLVKQARLVPLIKSETPIKAPSRIFITRTERLENPLFCPHDGLSLDDRQPITRHGTEVEGAQRAVPATRPVLTLIDDSEEQQNEARTAQSSTSQMKAARVLQTFVNPFGMYLPSSDGKSLPFQEKKLDPNSKVFEICSRWKLMKAPEKPKKSSAQPAKAKHAEKKMKVERPQEEPVAVPTVREQKQGATRREAPGAAEVTEVGGKRQRADSASLPAPPLVPDDFTPHEYTEADAHIFTGEASGRRGRKNEDVKRGGESPGGE
ncbi:uncharacterized protein LOC142923469 isoform X9 [Petromyzon marinus]|uniref:uncharacterized protein LOC142923469 isoform X9 n=1 Tax=Petromyzon marinus TaxID=7757 RepID=UPI003F6E53F6